MSSRYDVLVIDLDGTLLARDGSVSRRNCEAIARARESGLEVIIATGRALVESDGAIEAIAHDGLVVAAGGSLLCDAATRCTIDRRTVPHDVVRDVTQSLIDHGHKVLILKDAHATGYDYLAVGPGEMDAASKWWFSQLPARVKFIDSLDEDDHPHDTVRAGAVACETKLAPLAGRLRESLAGRCWLQHWGAVTETHATGSSTHLLEVFTANVNKWTMVEAHCRRQSIDVSRVAAIGDGLNDVELIRHSGLGVAMANASPDVLAAADRVTAHHESDGVALTIEQILDGAW